MLNKKKLDRALARAEKIAQDRATRGVPRGAATHAKGNDGKGNGKTKGGNSSEVAQALKEYDDDERKRLSIDAYIKTSTLAGAAKAVNLPRSTIERWIIEDAGYRELMINAHETVIDRLESLAFRRAKGTKDTPGSDDILKFLLRANRPGKFANSGAGAGGGGAGGSAAQRKQEEAESLAAAQRQKFKVAGQDIEF